MPRLVNRVSARLASVPDAICQVFGKVFGHGVRRARASFAVLYGRWRLYRHNVDGAVASFGGAARRAPETFAPWFHLARAHLSRRDWTGARRALARAREVAPRRFDAVAFRALRRDGFELSMLADPVPAAAVPAGQSSASAHADRSVNRSRAHEGAHSHPLGDCRDLDEYARFRSMPPITSAEMESVDWDVVADDLLE